MGIGTDLYYSKKTPKCIKKALQKRWDVQSQKLENIIRKDHPTSIFTIPFDKKRNARMYLPVYQEGIQQHILINKQFFEIDNLKIVTSYLPAEMTVLDLGANIGNHTVYFSMLNKQNRVYAFEPHHKNYDILKKNIELNNLDRVKTYHMAVGDKKGRGSLLEQNNHNLCDVKVCYDEEGSVTFTTLDDFIHEEKPDRIDLVKIDVEGFEENVIKGMKNLIDQYDPLYWIEIWSEHKEAVFSLLKEYNLYPIENRKFSKINDYLFKKGKNTVLPV